MAKRYFENPYDDVVDVNRPLAIGPPRALQLAIDTLTACFDNVAPTPRTFDGYLYTGYMGIAWAALYLLRQPSLEATVRSVTLAKASHYVQAGLTHLNTVGKQKAAYKEDSLSLLLGAPGVWITAVMLFQETGQLQLRDQYVSAYAQLAGDFKAERVYPQGSDEFFIGRAGYLAGIALLRSYTGEAVISDDSICDICEAIVQSGESYARRHNSPCPLMYAYYNTEYLGAAHGLAGILFALMLFPVYLSAKPNSEKLVRDTLAYLIGVTPVETGNLPSALDEVPNVPGSRGHYRARPANEQLVHWCHGATGAVLVYARAFVLWKDPRYLAECRRCADVVWHSGLLKKGPGICHGVAGSGYVFLLLYRLTGEVVYLHRAAAFAEFMQSDSFRHARRPDAPYSLYEGFAGTACFYADLASPSKAGFPLMDPLWDAPG